MSLSETNKARGEMPTLRYLQLVGEARANRWHGDMRKRSLNDWMTAFGGEVGEAMNAAKKLKRLEDEIPQFNVPERMITDMKQANAIIGEELADALAYLMLCASRIGVNIEQAYIKKFNEVSEKYGFPERI